jgi:ABC-type uncharacterized transport system involved in gliding motility auxiliary subunit
MDNLPDKVEIQNLASTTEAGHQNSAPFNLNPFQRDRPMLKKEDLKQYNLVLMAKGQFTSAYKGKEIPDVDQVKSDEDQKYPPSSQGTTEKDRKNESTDTSIFVVANSLFARDQYIASTRAEDNLTLLENVIDSMALGQDLMGIRTRSVAQRPIKKELSDAQKTSYKWITILGVPILVIIFGFLHIPWVRARRRYYETILTKE